MANSPWSSTASLELNQNQNANIASNNLDYISELSIDTKPIAQRLTGIVCTIGPASNEPSILEKMMENGMNIARLNFSHGTHEYHANCIHNLRTAVENYSNRIGYKYSLAIALDTKGSEIRTGVLDGGATAEVELNKGDSIKITTDESYAQKGNKNIIYVDYTNITKVLKPGDKIYIDDGLIQLVCEEINENTLNCMVENGGILGSSKGINLPGIDKDLPSVTEKDINDFKFAVKQNLDMIFASFTRNANDVKEIRKILGENILVVAKIENQQGIANMNEIIQEADGILIDRGDLGMEISCEKVFLAQKAIIARCNKAGKPIVIATHMLESMVVKPRPTRAESSDVANAVLDGADCVMLSGETAKGLYPVECVQTMSDICKEAEAVIWQKQMFIDLTRNIIPPIEIAQTVAIAAVEASMKCLASAIIVITKTGKSAQLVSRYRPKCPVVAATRNAEVARQLHLFRGILPLYFDEGATKNWRENIDARLEASIQFGKTLGFIHSKDLIIIVTGWKEGSGATNTMSAVYVE